MEILKLGITVLISIGLTSVAASVPELWSFSENAIGRPVLQSSTQIFPSASFPHPRIIGGRPAENDEINYQILLRWRGHFIFGGSLVKVLGKQVVLTAAHCVQHSHDAEEYTVVAGELDLNEFSGFEQSRQVTAIVSHPSFETERTYKGSDIAILQLESNFTLNSHVQPIELPKPNSKPTRVIMSGWGLTDPYGTTSSDRLQVATLKVVDKYECNKNYSKFGVTILKSMICSGKYYQNSCRGDSGGPLKDYDTNKLVGIVSFGVQGCGITGHPGVNTRVSSFIPWIKATVRNLEAYQDIM